MSVLFVSVPHTGNHTLFQTVGGRWARAFIDHRIADNQSRDSENFYRHTVLSEIKHTIQLASHFDHVLVPLRDPRAVACSYYVRGLTSLYADWVAMEAIVPQIEHALVCPVEELDRPAIAKYLGRPVHEVSGMPGSYGSYPERELYEAGDYVALHRRIGELYEQAENIIESFPLAGRYG